MIWYVFLKDTFTSCTNKKDQKRPCPSIISAAAREYGATTNWSEPTNKKSIKLSSQQQWQVWQEPSGKAAPNTWRAKHKQIEGTKLAKTYTHVDVHHWNPGWGRWSSVAVFSLKYLGKYFETSKHQRADTCEVKVSSILTYDIFVHTTSAVSTAFWQFASDLYPQFDHTINFVHDTLRL